MIEAAVRDCGVAVEGEGCDFSVVVSDAFQGLSPIKRQQKALAALR